MSPGSEGVPALPQDARLGQKAAGGAPSSASLDLSANLGFILRQTHTARRLNPAAFDRRIWAPVPSSPPENADSICRMGRANRKHPFRELATGQGKIRTPPYTPTHARETYKSNCQAFAGFAGRFRPPSRHGRRWRSPGSAAGNTASHCKSGLVIRTGPCAIRLGGHARKPYNTVQSRCPQRAGVVAYRPTLARSKAKRSAIGRGVVPFAGRFRQAAMFRNKCRAWFRAEAGEQVVGGSAIRHGGGRKTSGRASGMGTSGCHEVSVRCRNPDIT